MSEEIITIKFENIAHFNHEKKGYFLKELGKINPPSYFDFKVIEENDYDGELKKGIESKKYIVFFNGYSYNIGETRISFQNKEFSYEVILQKDVFGSRIKLDEQY